MSKILFSITFIFFYFLIFSQSNVYHPFPEEEAIWNTKDEHSFMGVCCEHRVWETSYIQSGDTIINGTSYNKIYRNQHIFDYNLFPNQCYCNYPITQDFFGGLRNEISEKKVYFFDLQLNEEKLLYNFNIGIGDTIRDYYNDFVYNIITSIDSIEINGNYRKRFNFGYDPQFYLDTSMIEGIGSLNGLFNPLTSFEFYHTLLCFQEYGIENYIYPESFTSCGVVGIQKESKEEFLATISPNPAENKFVVEFKNEIQNGSLILIDAVGKIVLKESRLNGSKHTIKCTNLPNGIYQIIILDDKELLKIEKLVISN